MPFDYYHRLSKKQQSIYRQSDAIEAVPLPRPDRLHDTVIDIKLALEDEDRGRIQRGSNRLAREINSQLSLPRVAVKVLARRPSHDWGELHGLYEPADEGEPARITVWMRTAKRKQVVAFKTYLRTVLHEIGHHLDYEYFRLTESFHTEGFYKRENDLYRKLTAATVEPVQQELSLGEN